MTYARLLALLLVLLALPGRAAADAPPVDPAGLATWWESATRLWLGDTAYKVKSDLDFEDGVCKATFKDGVFIPVWSGQPPVSERIVGAVFVGDGVLSMRTPDRADAWSMATHLLNLGQPRDQATAIARQQAPFTTKISRALLLSADPKVQKLMYDLLPVRSGTMLSQGAEGVDEVYMVTEERGKFTATVVATNLLPDRRRLLERSGLDAIAMVRQDRLLGEELGVPAEDLRLVADFRTDTSFGVAALDGKGLGPVDYDQWLTCFRDGLGQTDTGYRTMAFTHGVDVNGVRHFRRFSGETFPRASGSAGPEPERWMAPVYADTEVKLVPTTFSSTQKVTVSSTLTLEARGGTMQHVTLRLPTAGVVTGSFDITKLEMAGGESLAWAGLSADLKGLASGPTRTAKAPSSEPTAEPSLAGISTDAPSTVTSATTEPTANPFDESNPAADQVTTQSVTDNEGDLVQKTATRIEIIVTLPHPVPAGQQIKIRLDWKATWPYANWSTAGRPLGPTTGLQEILPELVPALGGTSWDFRTRVSLPTSGLRTLGVAVSGDTVRDETNQDDGWRTVEATGKAARRPAVAFGRWNDLTDPPAKGLPGVRVSLFTDEAWALPEFPPEVRRVVAFLKRFLPSMPLSEIEVFQGKDTFVGTAMRGRISANAYGLVGIQQVTFGDTGGAAVVEIEDPHFTQSMIARQIAGQIWGQLVAPATNGDAWILEALSESYAAFYSRAAFGEPDYEKRVDAVRASIERPVERSYNYKQIARPDRPLSLSGSTPLTDLSSKLLDDYGFYLMAEMLRFQVGDHAYFLALDRLARRRAGQRLTTEQLQEAFEETSERDLSDFFDYWVRAGLVPELTARFQVTGGDDAEDVTGVICSNIPFGHIEVPLVVRDQQGNREQEALIPLDDGVGSFKIDKRQGKVKVEVDPDGMVLAFRRDVAQVNTRPNCD